MLLCVHSYSYGFGYGYGGISCALGRGAGPVLRKDVVNLSKECVHSRVCVYWRCARTAVATIQHDAHALAKVYVRARMRVSLFAGRRQLGQLALSG